jgi:hypothetical protein
MADGRADRPLGDLIGTLTSQLGTLIRKEIELGTTELQANAMRTAREASLIGVGTAVVYAGFLALVGAAIALLVEVGLDLWLAAVAAAAVLFLAGYMLIQGGRSALEKASLAPKRTIESIRQDVEWAKDPTHD